MKKTKLIFIYALVLFILCSCGHAPSQDITESATLSSSQTSSSAKESENLLTNESATQNKITSKNTTDPQSAEGYCFVTIDIRNIKNNINILKSEKKPFVTSDGYILKETKVKISDGDTALDILKKACKENKCTDNCKYCENGIQLESTYTADYDSYYIEGIHQIYGMDCGSMSGWMFSVNGTLSNEAVSDCTVKSGDRIDFAYSCNMGADIG